MPFKNEWAARQVEPEFDDYRRLSNQNSDKFKWLLDSVSVILGLKNGKSKIQSFRFSKSLWDKSDVEKWLKSRDFKNVIEGVKMKRQLEGEESLKKVSVVFNSLVAYLIGKFDLRFFLFYADGKKLNRIL